MAKFGPTIVLAVAIVCGFPSDAIASVDLVGNARGDQVLFHSVLYQQTRPLYVGTRAPGGPFGPLVPLTPPGGPSLAAASVDDGGEALAAFTRFDPYGIDPPRLQLAFRPAGGDFAAPFDMTPATAVQLAANRSGDAILGFGPSGSTSYRFRLRGGNFGPLVDLPSKDPRGGVLAVDPDGSAAYFWKENGTAFDDPRGFESVRPPGGEFGAPTQIPDFPLGVAAVRNGRVLVVGGDTTSIRAAERPPGGHFSPPFMVAARQPYFTVYDVVVAQSGAAAVSFGDRRRYVTVRDPGGSFGTPQRISLRPVRLAVDEAGDVAAAWQRADHSVAAAYRPAGGSFGKSLVLASARPSAPGPIDPPALVIDGAGKATAAWEQSNGAKVATFVRSFDGTGLRKAVRVDVVPSFVREGPSSACRPRRKADLLARGPGATVFWLAGDAYGCLLARGAPVDLTPFDDDEPQARFQFAGPLVAHVTDTLGHSTEETTIEVTDLRDPYTGINLDEIVGHSGTTAVVPAIRLKADGAVAFVDYPSDTPRRKHVRVWSARAAKPRLVDSGSGIKPRSLELKGSKLTWRHGKRLRHATLR